MIGPYVVQHQHARISANAAHMLDPSSVVTERYSAQNCKMPWFRFMRMGQSKVRGGLLGVAHQYRMTGKIDDVPQELRRYLEKAHPEQLEPMTSWEHS